MSLLGALNIGGSALAAQQAALQVTGNNIANVGNPDYAREVANTSPAEDRQLRAGVFVGTGVDLSSIQRQVDQALNERLRSAASDNQTASTTQNWSGQVQAVFNALSEQGLSTTMNTFFNSWASLANNPADLGQRQVVIQNGGNLAKQFNSIDSSLTGLGTDLTAALKSAVKQANELADQVAGLNQQVVTSEAGGPGQANALRDQRDTDLKKLAQIVNIKTVEQPNGGVNVYVGNDQLVAATVSRGLQVQTANVNGQQTSSITFKQDNGAATVTGGQIGGMLTAQGQLQESTTTVNSLAHNLIFELNKLHASGQGLQGIIHVTAASQVTDPTKALSDPASGLQYAPTNGSFVVHVTDKRNGLSTSSLVQVHLTGSPSDTTLNSLVASLNGVGSVSASAADGYLKIQATNPNVQISFSQDSSGVLAALGVNTFYTGGDARTIGVNPTVAAQPTLLAAARNGNADDNQTAVALSSLAGQPLSGLGAQSLTATYRAMVGKIGTEVASAGNDVTSSTAVQQTLQAQQQNLSGVSTDEQALNMIKQQTAYQAAARLISAIQQMTQTLLAIQ